MRVIHRLVGYDQKTDRAKVSFKDAGRLLSNAKRIAKVPNDDPQAVWSYPLSPDQVGARDGSRSADRSRRIGLN